MKRSLLSAKHPDLKRGRLDKLMVVFAYNCLSPPVIPTRVKLVASSPQFESSSPSGIFPGQFAHWPNDWK